MISSLLSGFSITVIANFLVSQTNTPLSRYMMRAAIVAASSFLITVFAMTKLSMITTEGYPLKIVSSDLNLPRLLGHCLF